MIPNWLSSHANESDLQAIEAAVGLAESKTAGEIVPIIVRRSSASSHVPVLMVFVVFSLMLIVAPFLHWHLPVPVFVGDVLVDLLAIVVSVVLGLLIAKIPAVQRLATPTVDQVSSVFRRAQLEFYETGIPATVNKTGILIFVSMFERRAVILGDEAISAKLKPETWVEIIDEMLAKFGENKFREGYVGAIEKVGEILAREFPIKPGDTNELPNTLVVKD